MNRVEAIKQRLTQLTPIRLEIIDESHLHAGHVGARDGAGHYVVNICSGQFTGLNTVARHRMVYSALSDMMQTEIHALTINATTPT